MRSFIGIDFSKALKKQICDLQSDLKGISYSGRWKYIDNFHLTLKFLDEIDKHAEIKINEALKDISSRYKAFTLNISELGCFYGKECLRVLWLGLSGDLEMLFGLHREIDKSLASLDFEKEKRSYSPHVTIGQDIVFSQDFGKIRNTVDLSSFPAVDVKSIYMYKSEQLSGKRIYTQLYKYDLLS